MDGYNPRAPASSPVPEDISELARIAMGIGLAADDESLNLKFTESVDEGEQGSIGNLAKSESEATFDRYVKFMNSAKMQEVFNSGSKELKMIRDQLMEEIEWQKQGLICSTDGTWMADRDEELKRLRLKLAAKRGWDAIRDYIQKQNEDKQHQAAQEAWKNMFKVAKQAAQVEDKTLLDLYERYGFLGWDSRFGIPPYNPMFPEKSVKLAKERALQLHRMAAQEEMNESFEKAKLSVQKSLAKATNTTAPATSRSRAGPRRSLAPPEGLTVSSNMPYLTFSDHNERPPMIRAVTLLSVPHSSGHPKSSQLKRNITSMS